MVSEIRRTVVKGQESSDSRNLPVSNTRTSTEPPLTVAQTQTRSGIQTIDGPIISHPNLAYPENIHLFPQEPSLDATS